MRTILLDGKSLTLKPADIIGSGGEAEIYRIGGNQVLKLFKTSNHPDYAGNPKEQKNADARLTEHQQKLPAFPGFLPKEVITPKKLALDPKKQSIVGYSMDFVPKSEMLTKLSSRAFREANGISDKDVMVILKNMHRIIHAIHTKGIVIGDFNDLNVLFHGTSPWFIDADSMQFGKFLTRMFSAKFVDPLLCDPKKQNPILIKPHTDLSDWYAFAIMVMQSLLFVGPHGGVHAPADTTKQVAHNHRAMKGITVFDPEVRYPKPARHWSILPDDLIHWLEQVFMNNLREIFPSSHLELDFHECPTCHTLHARAHCPQCAIPAAPERITETHIGNVIATKIFETSGIILAHHFDGPHLHWLYAKDGGIYRENGHKILAGSPEMGMRFRIRGNDTVIATGNTAIIIDHTGELKRKLHVDVSGNLSCIDSDGESLFSLSEGNLYKISQEEGNDSVVGSLMSGNTLFWTKSKRSFGLYKAGGVTRYFQFQSGKSGIDDSINLPPITGQIIDATCCLSRDRTWLFLETNEGGKDINRCYLLDSQGMLLATHEATPGDGTWLGTIRGKTAIGNILLCPTDDGIVRCGQHQSGIVTEKEFPSTTRWVDSNTSLFVASDGIYAIRSHSIWKLRLQ